MKLKSGGTGRKIEYLDYGRYLNHLAKVEADVNLEYKNIIQGEVKLTKRGKEVLIESYESLSEVMKQLEFLLNEFEHEPQSDDIPEFPSTLEEVEDVAEGSKENVVPADIIETTSEVVSDSSYVEGSSLYLIENQLELKRGYRNAYSVMLDDFTGLTEFYQQKVISNSNYYCIYIFCSILRSWYERRHSLADYAHRLSLRDCYQKWIDVLIIHFATLCKTYTSSLSRQEQLSQFKHELLNWVVANNNQNTNNGKDSSDLYSYKGVPPELRKYDMNTTGYKPSYECMKELDEEVMHIAVCIEDLIKPILYHNSIATMSSEYQLEDKYLHSIRFNAKRVLNIDVEESLTDVYSSAESLLFSKEQHT